MQAFEYRGRREGRAVSGQLEAASSEAVAVHLRSVGVIPVEITEVRTSDDALAYLRARLCRRKVDLEVLIIFSRQMYAMIRAGIPIVRAIRAIAGSGDSPALTEALDDVVESVESGRELAASLQRHADIFPSLFISTIRMGEDMGRLEEAFEQLAIYLERERSTRKRLKSATRYPLLVVAAIVVALVVLSVFVLPVFAGVFAEFGAELPWATRLLIGFSELSVKYWPYGLGVALVGAAGSRVLLTTKRGRLRWHQYKLRLPVVGSILEKATLARFGRTFALAQRSGVPLIRGLNLTARVLDNEYMSERIQFVASSIERGETLTRAAAASGLFTPLVLQMMGIGEETGSVDGLLEEVADFYDREVDYELTRLGDAIEPILIVGMGILVLLLALGVYLPMWDLAGAARGG